MRVMERKQCWEFSFVLLEILASKLVFDGLCLCSSFQFISPAFWVSDDLFWIVLLIPLDNLTDLNLEGYSEGVKECLSRRLPWDWRCRMMVSGEEFS